MIDNQRREKLKCKVVDERATALKVLHYGVRRWLPKSEIQVLRRQGMDAEITIPTWLFRERFGA